jgi:hypothetical protein
MKFFTSIVAAIVLMAAFAVSDANAQCFVRNNVVAVQGFNSIGNSCFVQQQQVLVPQSTAFFTGSRVAFVNRPVFMNQPTFVNAQVVQRVRVRRSLFGRVQVTRARNFAVAPVVVSPIIVGRRNVFIGGF